MRAALLVFVSLWLVDEALASPRCGVEVSAAASADRARAHDGDGAVTLRGSGFALSATVERGLGPMCGLLSMTARATGELARSTADGVSALPDAGLFQATLMAGAAFELAPRWWLRGALGPTLLAYVSPRAFSMSSIGAATTLELSRELPLSRHWGAALTGRVEGAVVPDTGPTWLIVQIGLAVGVRRAW